MLVRSAPRQIFRPRVLEALGVLGLAAMIAFAIGFRANQPANRSQAVEQALDVRSTGERAIDQAQRRLQGRPADAPAMAGLASAYLLRARETADPSYYSKADDLLQTATMTAPDDPEALVVAGTLALTRHEFATALTLGERAVELTPYRAAAYGVLTDALVELGRYDEAVAVAQHMVDLRPDQTSFSRVSYLRELHGDLDGAADAMRQAVAAGAPLSEGTAWSEVQLGNLLFAHGDLEQAERAYGQAGQRIADYAPAIAGAARLAAANGDLDRAAALYSQAVQRLPLAEYAIALGDVYAKIGRTDDATAQYALVEATDRLFAANGVRTDLELAIFHADHGGDLQEALTAANAEYEARPSVPVTDGLAWVAFRAGNLEMARAYSREALRLGTHDPLILYHAGVIAQESGDLVEARALLTRSSQQNSHFSLLWSDDLAARLAALGGAA